MLTYEFDAKEIKEGSKEDNGTTGKEWNKDIVVTNYQKRKH